MLNASAIDRPRPFGRRLLIVCLVLLAILFLAGARNRAQARIRVANAALAVKAAALPVVPAARAAKITGDLHMEMSPLRPGTAADSARAAALAVRIRQVLAKYRDITAAVADGYKMFMPEVKTQKVYHFSNNWHAVQEAFRFDPTKPTSILYTKAPDGHFMLVGAMFTAPKRFSPDKLDLRVPLSIARWHKHVNWCVPKEPIRPLARAEGRASGVRAGEPRGHKGRVQRHRRGVSRHRIRVDAPRQRLCR